MSTNHPDPVSAAVETITAELQRLRRDCATWRAKAAQNEAQVHLMRAERDDALALAARLRAHCQRKDVTP